MVPPLPCGGSSTSWKTNTEVESMDSVTALCRRCASRLYTPPMSYTVTSSMSVPMRIARQCPPAKPWLCSRYFPTPNPSQTLSIAQYQTRSLTPVAFSTSRYVLPEAAATGLEAAHNSRPSARSGSRQHNASRMQFPSFCRFDDTAAGKSPRPACGCCSSISTQVR